MKTVAQLAVPQIADWCAVDVLSDTGDITRLAVAHKDPAKIAVAKNLARDYPEDPASPYGIHQVIRTRSSVSMARIPDELFAQSGRDAHHLEMLRDLGLKSYMCVPLCAHDRVLGVLTFVSAESGREYGAADLRFAEDVAARAALAIDNARAYDEARRANQLKDDFLATLSHELRTPLNAVLGYVRMLRSGAVPEDRRPRAMETVERNAAALNQIVEDVLDVSRIVAGKLRLHLQPVDVAAVVRDALATIEPTAQAKGVRIHSTVDPLVPPVSGDPERLQQVVWNLLSNAVKFTPRHGRVQTRVERINSHVEIVVSDTGIGIRHDFLPHVFERFRQADARFSREHAGLGLGLAIARHFVELHAGSITAASEGQGFGSTFRVRLPSMIVHSDPALERERVHPRVDATSTPSALPSIAGIRVLAIDDESDALALLADILLAAGAEVTTATSGREGLALLEQEVPDVIVTDLGMPGMDGFEFVGQVRARGGDPRRAGRGADGICAIGGSRARVAGWISGSFGQADQSRRAAGGGDDARTARRTRRRSR